METSEEELNWKAHVVLDRYERAAVQKAGVWCFRPFCKCLVEKADSVTFWVTVRVLSGLCTQARTQVYLQSIQHSVVPSAEAQRIVSNHDGF